MEKYSYSSDWIKHLEDRGQWEYYWCQAKLLLPHLAASEKIVEIGIGTKFLCDYLRAKGYPVVSIDIDPAKKPDRVMNVVDLPGSEVDFEVAIAFDLFEHIPYEEFMAVAAEFQRRRVSKLFLGLPLHRRCWASCEFHFPPIGSKQVSICLPKRRITEPHHHWELGDRRHSRKRLLADLSSRGYDCRESFSFKAESYFYFALG